MSEDVIGDEVIEMTFGDWFVAFAIMALISGWIVFLGMVIWSGIEWVISL